MFSALDGKRKGPFLYGAVKAIVTSCQLLPHEIRTFPSLLYPPTISLSCLRKTWRQGYKYKWEFVERGLQIVQGR